MSVPLLLLIVLAIAYVVAFLYRKMVSDSTDEFVHVSDTSGTAITKQQADAKKIENLDRVVNFLGILVLVYGLVWGALTIYQAFSNSGSQPG